MRHTHYYDTPPARHGTNSHRAYQPALSFRLGLAPLGSLVLTFKL